MEMNQCCFNACTEPVVAGTIKCLRHKKKAMCSIPECRNQVNKRNLCVGHGARDECRILECKSSSRIGGFCSRHASEMLPLCSEPNCQRRVASGATRCAYHVASEVYSTLPAHENLPPIEDLLESSDEWFDWVDENGDLTADEMEWLLEALGCLQS